MNILSLDLSTKSSGWAIYQDKELIDHGCITASSNDLIKRIYKMIDSIEEILNKYTIDKIIVEEVRPDIGGYGAGNQQTHKALMWLQASLAFKIHDNFSNIEIEYIYPSSWRAVLGIKNGRGIKRTTVKEADIAFVKENFNIEVNDDEADAICIGYAHFNQGKNEINWE